MSAGEQKHIMSRSQYASYLAAVFNSGIGDIYNNFTSDGITDLYFDYLKKQINN